MCAIPTLTILMTMMLVPGGSWGLWLCQFGGLHPRWVPGLGSWMVGAKKMIHVPCKGTRFKQVLVAVPDRKSVV